MALIQCPECNQEISNSSAQCIHCGCPIVVCKECGTVSTGSAEACSYCGFRFCKETLTKPTPKTISAIFQQWASGNFIREHYLYRNIATPFLIAIAALLWVTALVRLFIWKITGDAFGTTDAQGFATTMCIIASILMVGVTFLKEFRLYYFHTELGRWLRENSTNEKELVLSYMMKDFSKMAPTDISVQSAQARAIIQASLIGDDISYSKKKKIDILAITFFSLAEYIFLTILMIMGIEAYIAHVWFGNGSFILSSLLVIDDTNFFWENIWFVLPIIVTLIVAHVYENKSQKKERQFLRSWLSANLPEYKGKLESCIYHI